MTIRATVTLIASICILAGCADSSSTPSGSPAPAPPPTPPPSGVAPGQPAPTPAAPTPSAAPAAASGAAPAPAAARGGPVKTPSGLEYSVLAEGIGATPPLGSTVKVHLTGWRASDKHMFLDTRKAGVPREYKLTTLDLISGLVETLQTMRTGEKRRVKVPHGLGYGIKGNMDLVPPRTDLDFEIELVSFVPPGQRK